VIITLKEENCYPLIRLEYFPLNPLADSAKKVCFFADFASQNMVETTLPDGLETFGQRVYR
jgi:hypothetical protein